MAKPVKRIAFTDSKISQLIDLYQKNECLWDIKSPQYKDHVKRKAAVAYISQQMQLPEEIVKKKINSLRATYLLEKKKILNSRRTGTGTDDVYVPTVPWFNELVFLDDVIIPRKTTSSLDLQITQEEVEENAFSAQYLEETTTSPSPAIDCSGILPSQTLEVQVNNKASSSAIQSTKKLPSRNIQDTPTHSKRRKKSGGPATETYIDAAISKLCGLSDQDIFDNFGNLIASQLRSIPMEDAIQLQTDITALVNTRMLQIYKAKSSQPSSRNSVYSINELHNTNYENYRPSTSSSSTNQDSVQVPDHFPTSVQHVQHTSEYFLDEEEANTGSDIQIQDSETRDILKRAFEDLN